MINIVSDTLIKLSFKKMACMSIYLTCFIETVAVVCNFNVKQPSLQGIKPAAESLNFQCLLSQQPELTLAPTVFNIN